ncbi:hypothetical protein [Hoyosella subflava]|uniref:Uncharacterized protein n=1 Tax=Hoyosella subflava (strain DSM 45089 / JCM 17490 / NBRC 109087 / DQS3-9A1) TaxID=443218 RepID=F6EF88_HOYSD|nr:hypothetical protein [Hoyosella subflava]AEF38667.1 hypothetical protein AS9A_0207 [Hoyosella subflava DQS3-9A1]
MTEALLVQENGNAIAFSYDDLLRYNGMEAPGGVAHAFKVMERAFPLLDPGQPVERREVSIVTPFPGPGARDAFEMVTRAVLENRYTVDPTLKRAERGDLLQRYVFTLTYRERSVTLIIREGFVVREFIELARKGEWTSAEAERLAVLKQEMADRLLAKPATEVYDVDTAS